jgi:DNA-directed RNA polymerase subunit beta' (EC 2.7.7.6)
MIDAGARGSWSQPVQMAGMKGLVVDPSGDIIELPVKNSYKEGLDVLEYFNSTHGARKGTVDTALRTSTAGYLTRRLVDVAHEAIISQEDCGDTDGMEIYLKESEEIGQNFLYKVVGHVCAETVKSDKETIVKKGEAIDWETGRRLIAAGLKKSGSGRRCRANPKKDCARNATAGIWATTKWCGWAKRWALSRRSPSASRAPS